MKKELKQQWIAALRSGQYTQGAEYLKCNGNHCCLGVLCEVAGLEQTTDLGRTTFGYKEYYSSRTLPFVFQTEINLSEDTESKLMRMNDVLGQSFENIADYIEENIADD